MLTLDLHGIRHEDAKRKVELFIDDHWGHQITIITGDSSPMRTIVLKVIKEYNLCCQYGPHGNSIIIKEH